MRSLLLALLAALASAAAPAAPAPLPPETARALRAAAADGDLGALDRIGAAGIALDAPLDGRGTRAIGFAALNRRSRAVELLLGRGASPNARVDASGDGTGGSVALATLLARRGDGEVLALLLRYGAAVAPPFSAAPLHEALVRCDGEMVELLLRHGAPVLPGWTREARASGCPAALVERLEANDPEGGARFEAQWSRIGALTRDGIAALDAGDARTAAKLLEEAVATPAATPGLHRALSRAYRALGDEARGFGELARYLELAPANEPAARVRKELLGSPPAPAAAKAAIAPPWAVRWRCDGSDPAECEAQCARENGGSCVELARLAEAGKGVAKDPARALGLLDRGCDLGLGEACAEAAQARLDGRLGARVDPEAAERIAARGCWVTSAPACFVQANAVRRGNSIAAAVAGNALWARACAWGEPNACAALGGAFQDGIGAPLDLDRAIQLLEPACALGHRVACERLARLYRDDRPDPARAREAGERACKAGDASSCR